MKYKNPNPTDSNSRRKFLGTLAVTAGLSGLSSPLLANYPLPKAVSRSSEAEEWFKKIKGSHRVVYDAPEPHEGLPFIWAWVFYVTNNQTGTPDDDMTAMVVLRHNAIPFAIKDELWEKYKFGETFNIKDNATKSASLRNPYYIPQEGDFPVPEIEGIKTLQERGVLFCVCDMALTVYSGMTAMGMNLNPEDVKKDWVSGLLPDIQVVPSGVWALGRAQEHGCGYIYAGG